MATTTKFWTWAQIYSKMKSELDMDEEDFIDEDEMREYANDAIDVIEAHILTLCDDYFLRRGTITLVSGTDEYELPSDIYAMKIRGVVYYNGANIYDVKRIKEWNKFITYRDYRYQVTGTEDYRYFIQNETVGTPHILLSPPAYESGAYLEIWYLRQANRLESGTDICDIPEFISYIFDSMREKLYYKEAAGSAKHVMAREDRDASLARAIDTLSGMVPDTDNEIEPDTRFYEEMN